MGIVNRSAELAVTCEGHAYITQRTPLESRDDFVFLYEIQSYDENLKMYLDMDLLHMILCKN